MLLVLVVVLEVAAAKSLGRRRLSSSHVSPYEDSAEMAANMDIRGAEVVVDTTDFNGTEEEEGMGDFVDATGTESGFEVRSFGAQDDNCVCIVPTMVMLI